MKDHKENQIHQVALVVDDDLTMRLLMQKSLNASGIDTLLASNGEEALYIINNHDVDIVMLDVELPDTNGFTLCRKIRQNPKSESVPIIMVTSREDNQAIDAAYQAGATDYFAKPINWAILGKRVMLVLGSSRISADLRRSQSQNQAILNAVPDTLITINIREEIVDYRRATEDKLMPSADFVRNRRLDKILPKKVLDRVRVALSEARATGKSVQREFDFMTSDGQIHYELRLAAIESGDYVALLRNITERRQSEVKMRKMAYFDSLTKLPNRQHFQSHFATLLHDARTMKRHVSCMFIDLDNFKRINDTLGHDAGDQLLIEVAKRLTGALRTTQRDLSRGRDMLCRLGGDEFTVLLDDVKSVKNASTVADRILELLRMPIDLGEQTVVVTPSIGISTYPEHGKTMDTLVKAADSAMYRSKDLGRNNYQVFDFEMHAGNEQRLKIENRLRKTLETGDLITFYQPQFCPKTRQIIACEALVRWHDEELGFVSPAEFIPIAEDSGLILDVGDIVLKHVVNQISKWQELDCVVPVSVNYSSVQFAQDNVVTSLRDLLFASKIKAENLTIELTERVIMADVENTIETLKSLKNIGVSLSVDDFGTGYSSLAYLKRFPLDELKIDRTFIQNLEHDENDLSIVDAILVVAKKLGLSVVAEGVETEAQLNLLRERECDLVQGFLLGKPMSAADLSEKLQAQAEKRLTIIDSSNTA